MKWLIGVIAAAQALVIGVFAAAAMTGDGWGIARAVALLLALPFACLTGPALLLLSRGYRRAAALLAMMSALSMGLLWLKA